ncbi:uncharacterized protein Z520_11837 [Fonsecaea multimorphosa CBS 102226]|uniref:Uncharacterized protein n=1 Tax=Fonsecaea multimorphosa CBS 102226 TaxID=1442371 RepID=A0A0D2JH60_9EURO|nr:uncharacterized protein Z520_11837 [Fonsecaea multimorphosa CBS 102226]KIX92517.1 hypothetical protein Z520_11837 [Fonsecaea multimorphosa CBS 102226]OAL19629.1 hypothetical protein AYO22_09791 [Fonsecaea multimorphosa]
MRLPVIRYGLSKPYPQEWLTPVVVAGAIIVTIISSLISFASSGYNLEVVYSSDPNATAREVWMKNIPWLLTNKRTPTCQSTTIPINEKLTTNNTALTYTLTGVSQEGAEKHASVLIYHNNLLHNCSVDAIEFRLESLERTTAQIAISPWGVDLLGYVGCIVATPDGPTFVNLTAEYNYVPDTVSVLGGQNAVFVGRNQTTKASLFWGESLLAMYWTQAMVYLNVEWGAERAGQNDDLGSTWVKGVMAMTPNPSTADLTDLTYYNSSVFWITNITGLTGEYWVDPLMNPNDPASFSFATLWGRQAAPAGLWIAADSLAKSFQSTILTDLGQNSAHDNILNEPTLLQHFTANFSSIISQNNNSPGALNVGPTPGPAQTDYESFKASTGPIGVAPSVLATTYLCSVPHQKSFAELVTSILVADLVFLQAAWWLFRTGMDKLMERRDSQTHYCAGCSSRPRGSPAFESESSISLLKLNQPGIWERPEHA